MKPFTANVIDIIKQIPKGTVMTYGQVARMAGSPRGARQVVRILHTMSKKHQLPWHRVVNRNGQIVLKDNEGAMNQKWLLEDEGIVVSEAGQVNLALYKFDVHSPNN
ncbi:MGMT family protein [Virgibacillus ndiopensis]|uniref:MGMT family protein n=1 Tax=Virgibacillus ndiopensis TaxID=2004408 RepID=UPI000C07300D|nr:MGMT family protein [Virgibacillus ndiopensis]